MGEQSHTPSRSADTSSLAFRIITCAMLVLVTLALSLAVPLSEKAHAAQAETRPLLIIVAGFDGAETQQAVPYNDSFDWSISAFGRGVSLSTYYEDMSGGLFSFSPAREICAYDGSIVTNTADRVDDGVVHVTLHQAFGAWGRVNEDKSIAQDFARTVRAAFEAAGTYVDYGAYDVNGDSVIDPDELVIVVLVPGYDASALSDPDRTDIPVLWPHSGTISGGGLITTDESTTSTPSNDGSAAPAASAMRLRSYIALTEYQLDETIDPATVQQEPLGTLYHEFGHYLGLPDLYALNANAEKEIWGAYRVGPLSLMDSGGWAQALDEAGSLQNEPCALDAWSRYLLGWDMPYIVTSSGDYMVTSQESDEGYQSLLIPTTDPDQYYLIENRQPEGHDSCIAVALAQGNSRGGIVIWRIDKRIYRAYGAQNTVNDTDHAPGAMPLFFEVSNLDGSYTIDIANATPDLNEPFFDATSLVSLLGATSIELPMRGPDDSSPSGCVSSGITVSIAEDSARSMTVHVELPDDEIGTSSADYATPLDEGDALHAANSALGSVACTALLRETEADVAFVDAASIASGLSKGSLNFYDVYHVLPGNSTIATFYASGSQIIELLETSLEQAYQDAVANNAEMTDGIPDNAQLSGGILAVGGLSCTIDWRAEPYARVKDPMTHGAPIDPQATYCVATTAGAAQQYDLYRTWSQDSLVLFGSPADALRSFVQVNTWEKAARKRAKAISYIEPDGTSTSQMSDDSATDASKDSVHPTDQASSSSQQYSSLWDVVQTGSIVAIIAYLVALHPLVFAILPLAIILIGFVFNIVTRR